MKLLISGFEPFGGEMVNPSWEVVKRLPEVMGEFQIVKICLPTSFLNAGPMLAEAIRHHHPDVVLSLGQAGGRFAVSFERVALNIADAQKPDNTGFQPADLCVIEGGPAAYFSTLPVKRMQKAVIEDGIPAEISNSAGTFVCNSVMYTALHISATENRHILAGFIHLPYLPCQVIDKAKKPSMTLNDMLGAVKNAIFAIQFNAESLHTGNN